MSMCSFWFDLLVSSLHTILHKIAEGRRSMYLCGRYERDFKIISLAVKLFHLA